MTGMGGRENCRNRSGNSDGMFYTMRRNRELEKKLTSDLLKMGEADIDHLDSGVMNAGSRI